MFKSDFLRNYIKVAPLALASERSVECEILSQMPFEPPILDIGCGDGIFASILFDRKIDTGIDPNPIEISRCAKQHAYNELIECTGDQIPRADCSYKTVISNSVLEHIPDLIPVLKEVYRVLNVGGSFYITIPNANFEKASVISRLLDYLGLNSQQDKFNKFYNQFWQHYNCYEVDGWKKLFEECGYKVADYKEYNPLGHASLNDIMVPLALPSFVTRKYLKRWFLFPGLRLALSPLIHMLLYPVYTLVKNSKGRNTLIFFHLTK